MTSEQNKALYAHFVEQVINKRRTYDEIPELVHDGLCRPQRAARRARWARWGARRLHDVPRSVPGRPLQHRRDGRRGRQGRDPGDRPWHQHRQLHGHAAVGQGRDMGLEGDLPRRRTARSPSTGGCPTCSRSSARSGPPARGRRCRPRIRRASRHAGLAAGRRRHDATAGAQQGGRAPGLRRGLLARRHRGPAPRSSPPTTSTTRRPLFDVPTGRAEGCCRAPSSVFRAGFPGPGPTASRS